MPSLTKNLWIWLAGVIFFAIAATSTYYIFLFTRSDSIITNSDITDKFVSTSSKNPSISSTNPSTNNNNNDNNNDNNTNSTSKTSINHQTTHPTKSPTPKPTPPEIVDPNILLFDYQEYSDTSNNNLNVNDLTSFQKLFISKDHIIYDNPLLYPQCRNALLIKEEIHPTALNKLVSGKIRGLYRGLKQDVLEQRILYNQPIWGREQLHVLNQAVKNNGMVLYEHRIRIRARLNPLRFGDNPSSIKSRSNSYITLKDLSEKQLSQLLKEQKKKQKGSGDKDKDRDENQDVYLLLNRTKQTIYYHIPKCGSSSIHAMLEPLNYDRVWWIADWYTGNDNLRKYETVLSHPTHNQYYADKEKIGGYINYREYKSNYGYHGNYNYDDNNNYANDIDCGFTFVRHPISKLISGYYTVNVMLEQHLANLKMTYRGKERNLRKELGAILQKQIDENDDIDSSINYNNKTQNGGGIIIDINKIDIGSTIQKLLSDSSNSEYRSNPTIKDYLQAKSDYVTKLYEIKNDLPHWNISAKTDSSLKFEMFVKQLVKESYNFMHIKAKYQQYLHVGSQVGLMLANWMSGGYNDNINKYEYYLANYVYHSNYPDVNKRRLYEKEIERWRNNSMKLNFIGRMEYFEKHWERLINYEKCNTNGLDMYKNIVDKRGFAIRKNPSLKGQANPTTSEKAKLDKLFYTVANDRELYDIIVDYFYQDFVCFGYDMSYQSFVKFVKLHPQ